MSILNPPCCNQNLSFLIILQGFGKHVILGSSPLCIWRLALLLFSLFIFRLSNCVVLYLSGLYFLLIYSRIQLQMNEHICKWLPIALYMEARCPGSQLRRQSISSFNNYSIQCKADISTPPSSSAMRAQMSASLADTYTVASKSLVAKPDIKWSSHHFHCFPLNQWCQTSGAAPRLPAYSTWLISLNNCILKVLPKIIYLHSIYV